MNTVEIGDGVSIEIVRDGKKAGEGNFLGLIFIPPQGDYEWHAANGDWGSDVSRDEAIEEILLAWSR